MSQCATGCVLTPENPLTLGHLMTQLSFQIRLSLVFVCALVGSGECFGQGAFLSAGGPVHQGMGGASTAAPVSAIGALYWNPATISGLAYDELEVGLGFLSTEHEVSSSVGAYSATTEADAGVLPFPNVGWVQHLGDSRWTLGLGVNSIAGFKTNVPSDPANPVMMPAPTGLGGVSSEATFIQIAPTLSYALTDRVSVAAGPTITTGQIALDPFIVDSANANGSYSSGRATRYHWGGGVQAGIFYAAANGVNWGASIKSPTWMEGFEATGRDETGLPRTLTADVDLPMIISLGVGITQYQDWVFAADFRYFDYANADGFGDRAQFHPDGRLGGLDWSSVFATALGVERRLGERVTLRGGYTYNQSPIRNSESFYNMATPLFYQHMLSLGGSYDFCRSISFNTAYSHYFENQVQGPIVIPLAGPVPDTSVTNRVSADVFSFGVLFRH